MNQLKNIKITVVGSGYVGASAGVLLAQNNRVVIHDIDEDRVNKINNNVSPILDKQISHFLAKKNLNISATTNFIKAYTDADIIIIATPTNYRESSNTLDTSSVDSVVKKILEHNKNSLIVIKSTLPIGHTQKLKKNFSYENIIFMPEFIREGSALDDSLNPSRIIIGGEELIGKTFTKLLITASQKKDIPTFYMDSTTAEAVKLFSNSYLAMRVSFFNELDSFALSHKLSSKDLIDGICADQRIAEGYNNPSFGYGGYCLPKDTKQLLSSFKDIPQSIIKSIVESNEKRKLFLSDYILNKQPKVVGIYRLVMKKGSDNYRESATIDILNILKKNGINIIIYEPLISSSYIFECELINDINIFKELSDVILCNRMGSDITDVSDKVFTRDLYGNN